MKKSHDYFFWTLIGTGSGLFLGIGLGPQEIHNGVQALNSYVNGFFPLDVISHVYSILADSESRAREIPVSNSLDFLMWRAITGMSAALPMGMVGGLADLVELYVKQKKK